MPALFCYIMKWAFGKIEKMYLLQQDKVRLNKNKNKKLGKDKYDNEDVGIEPVGI